MAQNNNTKKHIVQADSLKCDSIKIKPQLSIVKLDSVTMEYIDAIYRYAHEIYRNSQTTKSPRYKLYKTENIYHHIKLDTGTGKVWQVQFGVKVDDMITTIDDNSLISAYEDVVSGRFELYPTNNMYNFILLDTDTGRIWRVQWSTESATRFRERIY